jgi:hypothetical protein
MNFRKLLESCSYGSAMKSERSARERADASQSSSYSLEHLFGSHRK